MAAHNLHKTSVDATLKELQDLVKEHQDELDQVRHQAFYEEAPSLRAHKC